MATAKAGLKAAKAALDAQKYDEATVKAHSVLETDPDNYHANVFLGLALEKQDKTEESEKAYNAAAKIKPGDPLVWQGLVTLYEKQAGKKIDQYAVAAHHLAEYFMTVDDRLRCQSVVDKYVGFAKQHGTRTQYKHALEMILPTSNIYDYLEGRVFHPALTYTRVAEIIEAEEKERINREIGERRTRLGAKIGQVTNEVKRDVWEGSTLERIYSSIIDWTQDDEVRRLYEERLLQRAYDTLTVLPMAKKAEKAIQVRKLADGLVILKHPFALAWKIVLEWKDVEEVEEWDAGVLREYIEFFPDDGLSKVLNGYLHSEISPFPVIENTLEGNGGEEDPPVPLSAEDRLIMMTEGLEESSKSVISQRLMGEYFLYLEEHGSAVECARKAKILILLETQVTGLSYQNTLDAIDITLGTSMVQYETPRNHPEARVLFENILTRKPTNTSALIGVGLILEEEEEYSGAIDFLNRALKRSSDTRVKAEAAWCKAQNGDYQSGLGELEACLSDIDPSDAKLKHLRSETLYRVGICLWNLDTSRPARKNRDGAYARFLESLKANFNFAPAYTSLGIYYADYAKDKKRARKCFQKAFELSPSEVEAAERLARAFADRAEWDLVEVVAQRVVQSGKVRPPPGSKKKGLSWPFAALGVCQLNNQDHSSSIVSFQSALRISPTDFHSWLGLGESYHNSGRYVAATKALEQALKIEEQSSDGFEEDRWFARYMLANVRRELGDFEGAIAGYSDVLSLREAEFGVAIALLQTEVESAWHDIELGLFGRAASSAAKAITIASGIIKHRSDAFNAWKAVGDACAAFSWVQAYTLKFPTKQVQDMLQYGVDQDIYNQLLDIDEIGSGVLESFSNTGPNTLSMCLHGAILSHKRAIHVCAHEIHAQAVAWYNLGWTEYRTHVCLNSSSTKSAPSRKTSQYLKASVRCFKRAIELEAGNSEFWNSLGIATTQLNPKVAQHAFVRSLHLNELSARVWTNLGTLYLLEDDMYLANESFTRAQSSDPEYAHAWLGQGILAFNVGKTQDAQNFFAHGFEIADSSSVLTKKLYATSMFDLLQSQSSSGQITDLLQPLFALHQLRSQEDTSITFQHLSALFAENLDDHAESIDILTAVCTNVEAEYEISESPLSLARFAQAKADLARVQLAAKSFLSAAEDAEIALDLSIDEDSGSPDPANRRRYRLSAHLTAGLAYYYIGAMDQAITMFRTALEETDGDPDTICMLAQVLWAKGGSTERGVAREQLFDCVEKYPEHSGAIALLGVIAILDDDKDTIKAVSDDLRGLRVRKDIGPQQQRKVGKLLAALATLNLDEDGAKNAEMAEATDAIMLAPSQPHGWSQLADLTNETFPADMAILTALGAVPPKGQLEAEDLCMAFAGTNRIADAQCAVMVAPWAVGGWGSLQQLIRRGQC